jgi:hypothetical protein
MLHIIFINYAPINVDKTRNAPEKLSCLIRCAPLFCFVLFPQLIVKVSGETFELSIFVIDSLEREDRHPV